MASAAFCKHGVGLPIRPAFGASSTHGYASQISPNKSVNCPCTSSASTNPPFPIRLRVLMHARLELSASDVVSVRSLAGLGENVCGWR